MVEEVKKPTRSELEAHIREAGSKGDVKALITLAKQLEALEVSERRIAEEAKARVRGEVTASIVEVVKPILIKSVPKTLLRGTGNHVRIDWEPDAGPLTIVVLDTTAKPLPTARKSTNGDGTGRPGKMRELYGASLDELFRRYATAEQLAQHDAAANNSSKYAIKNRVVQKAVDDGLLKAISAAG